MKPLTDRQTDFYNAIWECAGKNYNKYSESMTREFINTRPYYITTSIRLYIFFWVIYLKIKPELLGGKFPIRYIEFKDTHLDLMDIPHGNWDDK
jgi:hypothetical protein